MNRLCLHLQSDCLVMQSVSSSLVELFDLCLGNEENREEVKGTETKTSGEDKMGWLLLMGFI